MTEQPHKPPGRLAQAAVTARVAAAVLSPMAGAAAPVPMHTNPEITVPAQSQVVDPVSTKQLAHTQAAEARERRRKGLELGHQLKQPDAAQVDPATKAPKRGGRR